LNCGTGRTGGTCGTNGTGRELWILNWVRAASSHQRGVSLDCLLWKFKISWYS